MDYGFSFHCLQKCLFRPFLPAPRRIRTGYPRDKTYDAQPLKPTVQILAILSLLSWHRRSYQVHVDDLAQVRVHQLHDDVEVEKLLQALLRREGIQKTNDLKREEKANQIFCLQPGTDKKLKLEIKAKGGLGLKPQKHGIAEVF